MNPLFELFMTLLKIAFLCLFSAIIIKINDACQPRFYKLHKKVKKAEAKFRKEGCADTSTIASKVKVAFLEKKIDEMEKEYLLQRLDMLKRI